MPNSDVVEGRGDLRLVDKGVKEAERRQALAQARIVDERDDASKCRRASRSATNQEVLATDDDGKELRAIEKTKGTTRLSTHVALSRHVGNRAAVGVEQALVRALRECIKICGHNFFLVGRSRELSIWN